MSGRVRVVIIGGGVMGVSLLYHLARRGWTDSILLEKDELTAGSTWHAAGLCTHFAHNPTVMQLRATSIRLYRDQLPHESGNDVGFHASGALRITRSAERMAEFRHVCGLGAFMGHSFRILTPSELREIYPLVQIEGLVGAIHEPCDGHVDPTLATNAMAGEARKRGATIRRHCAVRGIEPAPSRGWRVHTDRDAIESNHVVNAAGTWCREVGDMMGVDVPAIPMLHQYLVTEGVPAIVERITAGDPELPIIRDPEESWYVRQERDGLICGPYERDGQPWAVEGIPPEFGMQLLPPDLERVEHIVGAAMHRIPVLAEAGIKTIVNGPITFTPDANPLIGPAFGLEHAWLLTGSSMGVMEGGGAGAFLADWMVDGIPSMDPVAVDPRRFGDFADRDYCVTRAVESFGMQFGIHFPYEERAAGRPRYTTPIHEAQSGAGAVFGAVYGWERPNWFATGDSRPGALTFERPGWLEAVAAECGAVHVSAGLGDLSALAKFELTGPKAQSLVSGMGANQAPARDGRIAITHVLNEDGGVAAEFTVTRLGGERFYLTSAAVARRHDHDLLRALARSVGGVTVDDVTQRFGVLAVMGPHAPAMVQSICEQDLGINAFPWLTARTIAIAGVKLLALRVSYVGEAGFELHVPMVHLRAAHDALRQAGHAVALRPFGAYAMNSMRLEKGYRASGVDLTVERTPLEAGLGHLVRSRHRRFTGREAMLQRAQGDGAWHMRLLAIEAQPPVHPFYMHCVRQEDRVVGMVTSAAVGHRTGLTLALAYLRPGTALHSLHVDVLGLRVPARILEDVPFDPGNRRQRGEHA